MKKFIKCISALLCVLAVLGTCACSGRLKTDKKKATLAVSSYSYGTESASDLGITFEWNDAAFTKLTLDDSDVDGGNYSLDGAVLTLKKEYLVSLGGGVHAFVAVTDLGNLPFSVTVVEPQGVRPPSIDDLISSDYYNVKLGEGNGLTKLPSADSVSPDSDMSKYLRFKAGNKPLEVGESFTCNFGVDDFYDMRLRPYNDLLRPNSFREEGTAAFSYVTDEFGTGLKAKGDNYYGSDTVKLKGSSFLPGANYTLSVTYSAEGGGGQVRFYNSNIIALTGTAQQTKSNNFTVPADLMLTGDHTWYFDCLLLDVAGGGTVTVYSLTLTRNS